MTKDCSQEVSTDLNSNNNSSSDGRSSDNNCRSKRRDNSSTCSNTTLLSSNTASYSTVPSSNPHSNCIASSNSPSNDTNTKHLEEFHITDEEKVLLKYLRAPLARKNGNNNRATDENV